MWHRVPRNGTHHKVTRHARSLPWLPVPAIFCAYEKFFKLRGRTYWKEQKMYSHFELPGTQNDRVLDPSVRKRGALHC